jgi:hypothetical protein
VDITAASDWLGVCGGTDHVDHKLGIGQHRYVAAVDLVNGAAHTFRHKALQLGLHCAVTRGHDVPARFRLPSGALHILGEQVRGGREVSSLDDLLLLLQQVSGEACDAFREHPDAPVCDFDMGENVCGRKLAYLTLFHCCSASSHLGKRSRSRGRNRQHARRVRSPNSQNLAAENYFFL